MVHPSSNKYSEKMSEECTPIDYSYKSEVIIVLPEFLDLLVNEGDERLKLVSRKNFERGDSFTGLDRMNGKPCTISSEIWMTNAPWIHKNQSRLKECFHWEEGSSETSWLQYMDIIDEDEKVGPNCSIRIDSEIDSLIITAVSQILSGHELKCSFNTNSVARKPPRDSGIGVTSGEGTSSSSNQSSPDYNSVRQPSKNDKDDNDDKSTNVKQRGEQKQAETVCNRRRLMHICDICGKQFDRPSLLKRHERTHTGERPYMCTMCDKRFSTSSSLNTHQRIHTGDKPHACSVCGKRFAASSNLYYHRMTHTTVKPHKCPHCPKSFPTPGDLKSHIYIHTEKWPFKCELCNHRGFSKANSLRNHQLLRHSSGKVHPCEYCEKKFSSLSHLKTHTKDCQSAFQICLTDVKKSDVNNSSFDGSTTPLLSPNSRRVNFHSVAELALSSQNLSIKSPPHKFLPYQTALMSPPSQSYLFKSPNRQATERPLPESNFISNLPSWHQTLNPSVSCSRMPFLYNLNGDNSTPILSRITRSGTREAMNIPSSLSSLHLSLGSPPSHFPC